MPETPESSVQETQKALQDGNAVLIDVRQPWEYEESRIPGAVLIPLAELQERIGEVPDDRDVYVHCALGQRSAYAVDFLVENGRPRARNVKGGIDAWRSAGLPVDE